MDPPPPNNEPTEKSSRRRRGPPLVFENITPVCSPEPNSLPAPVSSIFYYVSPSHSPEIPIPPKRLESLSIRETKPDHRHLFQDFYEVKTEGLTMEIDQREEEHQQQEMEETGDKKNIENIFVIAPPVKEIPALEDGSPLCRQLVLKEETPEKISIGPSVEVVNQLKPTKRAQKETGGEAEGKIASTPKKEIRSDVVKQEWHPRPVEPVVITLDDDSDGTICLDSDDDDDFIEMVNEEPKEERRSPFPQEEQEKNPSPAPQQLPVPVQPPPVVVKKPQYCRKCRNHNELRPKSDCSRFRRSTDRDGRMVFRRRCPYENCRCQDCKVVDKHRKSIRDGSKKRNFKNISSKKN